MVGRRHRPQFGTPQRHTQLEAGALHPNDDSGVYGLVLRLPWPRSIGAGKLGERRLAAGWYVYLGTAKRNLVARLARHLRHEKRPHWHIDYLRAVACVEQIWIWPWSKGAECRTNGRIQALSGASVPWKGFGSSDCRCAAHLTLFGEKPTVVDGARPLRVIENVFGSPGRAI